MERLQNDEPKMAASAAVISDSVISANQCRRSSNKFYETNDLKPYLTSVSRVVEVLL
jgi:hypothetical protein